MKQLSTNSECTITVLAVFLLLLSAMVDPRISAGLAFIFLIMNWLLKAFIKRNWT